MRHVGLPDGVTVAQQTLNLFVMVQIHVGQPNLHLQPPMISSALAFVTPSWKSSLHFITGAVPQPARHSTNSIENFPSFVVCKPCACGSRPSLVQKCSCSLCEPPSAQLNVRQTLICCFPTGACRNIG